MNVDKSAILLHLRGTKNAKWKSRLLRQHNGRVHLRLAALQKGGDVLHIPVVTVHKYLGIMISYNHAQDQTLKHRINAAQTAFIRLRTWWKPSLPLRARMDLWFQIVWPTLTYGLADVGLSKRGIAKCQTLIYRHWRHIAKSPVHLTRESNADLINRLGVADPMLRLACGTLRAWQRRLTYIKHASSQDIMHEVCSAGASLREMDGATFKWYLWCADQWLHAQPFRSHAPPLSRLDVLCSPLDHDLPEIFRHLGVPQGHRAHRWDMSASGEAVDNLDNLSKLVLPLPPPEKLTCEHCSAEFPHQMALRRHVRHMHSENIPERRTFLMTEDAYDGMPTCRHCGMRFRKWQGLHQHIATQVCQNLREGHPVYERILPVCERDEYTKVLRDDINLWEQILEDRTFLDLTRHHCVLCHQWFPRASSLGYHLQHAHNDLYVLGKIWCMEKFRAKVLVRHSNCMWCGYSMAESSLPKHCCPVIVQLGVLIHHTATVYDDGSCTGSGRGSGNLRQHAAEQHRQGSRGAPEQEVQRESVPTQRSRRRIRIKSKSDGQEQRERQGEERQACQSRELDAEFGALGHQNRRPHQSPTGRYSFHALLPHVCKDPPLSIVDFSSLERNARVRSHSTRDATSHSPTALPLGRADQVFVPTRRVRGKRATSEVAGVFCVGRQAHVRSASLVPGERAAADGRAALIDDRGQSYHHRTNTSSHGTRYSDEIPQCQAFGRGVQGTHSSFLPRTGTSSSAFGTSIRLSPTVVRHEYHGVSGVQASSSGAEAFSSCQGSSRTAEHALKAWWLNGRDLAIIPTFHNNGNRCYYISVIVALVRCMTYREHDPTTLEPYWGPLAMLLRYASEKELASLEAVPSISALLSTWRAPGRQHDAAEFLCFLGSKVPILSLQCIEQRIQVQDVVVVEWRSPVAFASQLEVPSTHILSLSGMIRHWFESSAGIIAYKEASPVIYLHLERFAFEAGAVVKRASPIRLDELEVELPVFAHDNSIAVVWHSYRICAYVIHLGESMENGHYITALPCDGGYVIADDDKPCRFHSTLPAAYTNNIYLVFLAKYG